MIEIILFLVGVIGFTHIVVDSKIFEPIREIAKKLLKSWYFLDCYQCTGFWCGLICGMMVFPMHLWLIAGFAGSFLATFGAILLNYFEAKTVIDLE